MIDSDGYRPNVGIVICNGVGQLLWARRYGQNSWQFPQGGINSGETPEQAMYRELYEEVGLKKRDVKVLAVTKNWLRYKLPKRMVRWDSLPICIGQKQKWFLLELVSDEKAIDMILSAKPEFDGWKWVSYWYPIRQVVVFKRDVYRRALKEFASFVIPQQALNPNSHFVSPINSFRKPQHKVHSEKLSVQNENLSDISQLAHLNNRNDERYEGHKKNERNERNDADKNSLQEINASVKNTAIISPEIDTSSINFLEINSHKKDSIKTEINKTNLDKTNLDKISADKTDAKHNIFRRKKRKNKKNQRNRVNKI